MRRAPPPRNHWSSSWRRKGDGDGGTNVRLQRLLLSCSLISARSGDLPPDAAGRMPVAEATARRERWGIPCPERGADRIRWKGKAAWAAKGRTLFPRQHEAAAATARATAAPGSMVKSARPRGESPAVRTAVKDKNRKWDRIVYR